MKNKITNIFAVLFVSLMASLAVAADGVRDGGGADAAQDETGKRTILDLAEKDHLRYFNFSLSYDMDLANFFETKIANNLGFKASSHFFVALNKCMGNPSPLGETEVDRQIFPSHVLRWAKTDLSLEDIHDEGVHRLLNEKSKRQLAIQKGDLVVISETELARISGDLTAFAALKIHEATLCALLSTNPKLIERKGTESVRRFVRELIAYVKDIKRGWPADVYALEQSVTDFGIALPAQKILYSEAGLKVYLQSRTDREPNVIASCYVGEENGQKYYFGGRISLASGKILEAGRVNDLIVESAELGTNAHIDSCLERAQKVMTKNQLSFRKEWKVYYQSAP